ncbi:MAG: hypothetical protein A2V98_03280 [Planctomycetes bacterium RBG_16_64_12]|nr:MAG: hypothetical protein A2V98_03280 [Planctomycetes bacterium RBG_16_64_12]
MLAVVMLVALRLTIGWHFLYEGVWKIEHADKFSATALMATAKGPAAPLFLAMIPDLDGRQRLDLKETEGDHGQKLVTSDAYVNAWAALKQKVVDTYQVSDEQAAQAEKLFGLYKESLESYLADNREDIEAYFGSLERLEARKAAGTNGAAHEKKRIWDAEQKLRTEVKGWLSDLDGMGEEYRMALWDLLDDDQKALGPIRAPLSEADALPVELPWVKTRTQLFDGLITYGLTAIGACLILGFCTRLAALGGAAFLVSVLLVQPPWPTIYPPAPEVVGHALVVDKNFVEMIAMIVLATTAVGRWGGLDYFVYHWLGRPILSCFCPRNSGGEEQESGNAV